MKKRYIVLIGLALLLTIRSYGAKYDEIGSAKLALSIDQLIAEVDARAHIHALKDAYEVCGSVS